MSNFQEEILQIKINKASFESDIKALFAKHNTLDVKAKLVASSVTTMIKSLESLKATVKVKAVISNLKEIETSLNAFNGSVNIDVLLNFDKAVGQINKFKPTKAIILDAKLSSDSINAFKADLKALQKDLYVLVKPVLSQQSTQSVETQIKEIGKSKAKTIKAKVEVDKNQLDQLTLDLSEVTKPKTIDVKVNVDQKEIAKLNTDLNAIDKNTDINLDVSVNNENLIKLEEDLKSLPETKEIKINVETDKTALEGFDSQIKETTKDRHVNISVGIAEPKLDLKEVDANVKNAIEKILNKVQKGLSRPLPVSLSTLKNYAKELQSSLSSLESTDEVELFNASIDQLKLIDKKLKELSNKSIDFDIPQSRSSKQKPLNSLEQTKSQLKLDPIEVEIHASLNQAISDEAITSLKTKVEASIKELKTFISNGLQTAIAKGFDVSGLTVDGSISLSGLAGLLDAVSALKQLQDFGALGVNAELDKILEKGAQIEAWVKSTQNYSLQLGISFRDLDVAERAELIADIHKKVGEIELQTSLALVGDVVSTLNAAIRAVEIKAIDVAIQADANSLTAFNTEIKSKLKADPLDLELSISQTEIDQIKSKIMGIDLTPLSVELRAETTSLYGAIDKCIEEVNKKTAFLPIQLSKDAIYNNIRTLLDYVKAQEASIQIGGDRTLVDQKLEEIKSYIKATEACLVLCLNDSKFLDELAALKKKISDDVAKLRIKIEKVDTNAISNDIENAVEQSIKEISIEDLSKIKSEISSAKAQATNLAKGKNVDLGKVNDRLQYLKSARTTLEGTGNEKILGSLNETIDRLTTALGDLPSDLSSNFQLEIDKAENHIEKQKPTPHEEKYGKTEKIFKNQLDMYADMGMDASPQLTELIKQVARAVATIKGLEDVWTDDMLPPVFAKGSHNNPAAQGGVFSDGSGMALREDIATFLENPDGVGTDAFKTVVHEITHVMQQLAIKLGRDIPYEKTPRTMEEAKAVVGMRSNPVYQAKNQKDNGHTFAIEEDANLTAMRHFSKIAEMMGIKLKDVIHPLKKLEAQLKAYETIKANSGKVQERYTQYFGQAGTNIATKDAAKASQQSSQLEYKALHTAFSNFDMDAQYQMEDIDVDYVAQIKAVEAAYKEATKSMREFQETLKPSNAQKITTQQKEDAEKNLDSVRKQMRDLQQQKADLQALLDDQREKTKRTTVNTRIVERRIVKDPAIVEAEVGQINSATEVNVAKTQATESAAEQKRLNEENNRLLAKENAALTATLKEKQAELTDLKKQGIEASQAHAVATRRNQLEVQILGIKKRQAALEIEKLKLSEATQTSPDRIAISSEQKKQAEARTQNLQNKTPSSNSGGSTAGGGSGNNNSNVVSGTTPDPWDDDIPQINEQIVEAAKQELSAARLAAKEALEKAREYAAGNASFEERQQASLDLEMKVLKARKLEVDLALKKLALAEQNATSFDRIEKARLDVEQSKLRLANTEQRIIKSRLDNQIKAQRMVLNDQRIKAGERREAKDTAARSYGSTGGSRSQLNAERRLPINLGLNVLEASNNRLGNIARIFVDIQEGILAAAKEGESFNKTLARVAVPIGIIGTIGAMATLIGITVPTINAIQKLEKSLTAFGQQSEFSDSLAMAKDLALEYGASLSVVASELSKFKTSLADSSISDQADSIFGSLVAYGSTVGASQDELSRGLVALSQIASKGKVSLEELNGQLSEAIPGASSIAAKSLGITKAEMFKMAAAGDLLSDEFLPKFRDELVKIDAAQKVLGKTTLSQAFGKLQQALIISAIPATTNAVRLLTDALESLSDMAKNGIPNPFSDSEEPLIKLTTILKAGLTAGFIYLTASVLKLLPIQKTWSTLVNLTALGVNRLTKNTAGLSQAQVMAGVSARGLGVALKGMLISAAPMIALTLAASAFFAVIDAKKGQDMFAETNKNLKESAENIKKLKDSVLKDLADLETAQNKGKPNPNSNPGGYSTITGDQQKNEQEEYKKSNVGQRIGADFNAIYKNAFKDKNDPTKVKVPFQSYLTGRFSKEKRSELRLAFQEDLGTSQIDSILKDSKAQRDAYDSVLKAKQGYNKEQIKKDVIKLEGVNETISSFGTLQKAFSDGRIEASSLKTNLMEIGVPSDLIPEEIGDPLATTEEKAKALEEVLMGLNETADGLKMGINTDDLEKVKLRIENIKTALSQVNYGTPEWKKLNAELKASQAQYRDMAGALESTAKLQSKVNAALIEYNNLRAENEGTVELATVLSEVALKEEALNSGIIKRSQLERQFTSIKARAFTARMAQIKAERIALDGLTTNLDKKDAFEIKAVVGDPGLFTKNNDAEGTVNFAIDRATVTQLNDIIALTEGKITDSTKKSLEAYRDQVSGLSLAYAQQQSGLQDLEFDIREKASMVRKETESAIEDVGKQMRDATRDFMKSFADALKDINREVTSLSNDLAKLKLTNASKQFNNALKRFALNAEGDLDEGILENIRLRNEIQTDEALSDIDFKSESERIAASFADGVSEINQAFADYLEEFKKLQNDLIKARQEKAKADQEEAQALADLKGSGLKPNLGFFDLNRSQLNQGTGKSIKSNAIPDSEKLIQANEKVGEEARKQTEASQKQLAQQISGNASIDVQTATIMSGHDSIVSAINGQSGAEFDLSNLDVFNAQLAVLVQVRDLLAGGAMGGNTESKNSKQSVVAKTIESTKSAYEARDKNIDLMNDAMDRFAAGETDDSTIKQFASAQKEIKRLETSIHNLESTLDQKGIDLGKPIFDAEKDSAIKDSVIASGKTVATSKHGTGVFETRNFEAEKTSKEATLAANQTKYGTKSGIPMEVLNQMAEKLGYLKKMNLAEMSYGDVRTHSTRIGTKGDPNKTLERMLEEFEGKAREQAPIILDKKEPTKGTKSGVPTEILDLMTKFYNKQGYGGVNNEMLDNLDANSLNALANDAGVDLNESVKSLDKTMGDNSNASADIKKIVNERIEGVGKRKDEELKIRDENKKIGQSDREEKSLQIEANSKAGSTIDNLDELKKILEESKIDEKSPREKAKEVIRDQFTKLDKYSDILKTTDKQIADKQNTLDQLKAGTFKDSNGKLVEGDNRLAGIKDAQNQINALLNDETYKAVKALEQAEKDRLEPLIQQEMYAQSQLDILDKQLKNAKVLEGVSESKKDLEDPNINPVQKIELERNVKVGEQALSFGADQKTKYDEILKTSPGMAHADAWRLAGEEIQKVNNADLSNLEASADSVKNKLKSSFVEAFTGILNIDFADTSKTLSEKIFGVFDGILKSVQSWAAGKLGDVLSGLLSKGSSDSAKGSPAASALSTGLGAAAGAAGGGWAGIAASVIGAIFADGGEVGQMASQNSIAKLMETERIRSNGKMPVLAALHMGEHVLSTKNKDAQAFQSISQNGVWDAIKSASGFANGGGVGNAMKMNQLFNNTSSQSKTINNISNFSFSASNDQLIQRTEAQIKSKRNNYL